MTPDEELRGTSKAPLHVTLNGNAYSRWGWVFGILAIIGVGVLLLEVALHVVGVVRGKEYEINHMVLLIGMLLGFVGFYGLSPQKALAGGEFIVKSGTDILKALKPRFGRRSTDAVAIPEVETKITAHSVDEEEGK